MQNFGSMDILCSDKTGTLTSGEMVLDSIRRPVRAGHRTGFCCFGLRQQQTTRPASRARSTRPSCSTVRSDAAPTAKLDEIPFDFERRRLSVVVNPPGQGVLITKGAPESVLPAAPATRSNQASRTAGRKCARRCSQDVSAICARKATAFSPWPTA